MFLFLKKKEEVLEVTFSSFILAKALMISSVIPSLKYSFSESELILTKGRTAMDFLLWANFPLSSDR